MTMSRVRNACRFRRFSVASRFALVAVSVALSCTGKAGAQTYEATPTLDAARLVQPELLQGRHFKVRPQANVGGFLARFDIESAYGNITAVGTEMLRVRVSEMPALQTLRDVSQSKAFVDALARSAKAPVDFAKSVATDPKQASANVANGVSQLFVDVGRAVDHGTDYVGDKASDVSRHKSDAHGSGVAPNDDVLGYNKAKREWARKLGVDPYSTNPLLQERLAMVARATFAGNFSGGLVTGAVLGPLQYAVDLDHATRDAVWDLSPSELQARNESRLAEMGIAGRGVRDLFRTPSFTPTVATSLVAALGDLKSVRDKRAVIDAAPKMLSEVQARYLRNAVRMLALYSESKDAVVEIGMSGRVLVGQTRGGLLIVPAAVDYIRWSQEVAAFVARNDLPAGRRTLVVTGTLSETAKRELTSRGWQIDEGFVIDR